MRNNHCVLLKFIAMLLALTLLQGALAACSGKSKDTDNDPQNGDADTGPFVKTFKSLSDVSYDPLDHILPPSFDDIVIYKEDVDADVAYQLAAVVMGTAEYTDYTEKDSAELRLYDTATITYVGLPTDENLELSEDTIAGMSNISQENGSELVIGSGMFIGKYRGSDENKQNDGFESQLIGMKVGEERIITVTFPDSYTSAELCGVEVNFTVNLLSISRPKIDNFVPTDEQCDEYTSGDHKTLEDFRDHIENACIGTRAYSQFVTSTGEKTPCKELIEIYMDQFLHKYVVSQEGSSLNKASYDKAYADAKNSMYDVFYGQCKSSALSYIIDNYLFTVCEITVSENEIEDAIIADWEENGWYYKYYYNIESASELAEMVDMESLEHRIKLMKLSSKLADYVSVK